MMDIRSNNVEMKLNTLTAVVARLQDELRSGMEEMAAEEREDLLRPLRSAATMSHPGAMLPNGNSSPLLQSQRSLSMVPFASNASLPYIGPPRGPGVESPGSTATRQ